MRLASSLILCLLLAAPADGPAATPDQIHKVISGRSAARQSPKYSANTKTRKYHKPGCKHYSCRDCLKRFWTPEDAESAGYEPCKVCWR